MTAGTSGVVIKEIRSKRDLADYFTSFTDTDVSYSAMLAHYVGLQGHGRAKIFEAINCASHEHLALIAEFHAEQQRRLRRGKGRTVYHFVISRRGRTSPEVLASMARRFLVLAGLENQKALIAVHCDTDDNHVHIAVSALGRDGRQIILERGYSKVLLAHINAQLCHEFGFSPEKGLGFHAADEGVFRTADGMKLRDADFRKVTNDLRKQPALTARSAASERETGLPSVQRRIRDAFERAMSAETLERFSAYLAVDGISYELEGSGAVISLEGERFKASRIARGASPKNIAKHFGVTHLTKPEAVRVGQTTGPGFFRRDDRGALQQVPLATAMTPPDIPLQPLPGAEPQYRQHLADQGVKQKIISPALSHTDPLRQRIDLLSDRPTPSRKWQIARLQRAIHRSAGRPGRPPCSESPSSDRKLPEVDVKHDTAILLGPARHTRWNGPPIWADARVKKVGPLWHVTRDARPVATFGPGMIVVHNATAADKHQIMKLAKLDFGSDVEAYCKPADRRSWVATAHACDVVLGNSDLLQAHLHLGALQQRQLARLAARLASSGGAVIDAGAKALGVVTEALKVVAPIMDRTHVRGRERIRQLSDRLSVQHERIAVDRELAHRERAAATTVDAEHRTVPVPEVVRPTTVPSVPAAQPTPNKPASLPRRSEERTLEIGEDGLLRPVWPEAAVSVERSADKPSSVPLQPSDLPRKVDATEPVSPDRHRPLPGANTTPLPANAAAGETSARKSSANAEASTPSMTTSTASNKPETKFEEAIRLIHQFEVVPCVEAGYLQIRRFAENNWRTVSIPAGSRKVAEDAREVFAIRVNAIHEAISTGEIAVTDDGRLRKTSFSDPSVWSDATRLASDGPSMEPMRRVIDQRGAPAREDKSDTGREAAAPMRSSAQAAAQALQAAMARAIQRRLDKATSTKQLAGKSADARAVIAKADIALPAVQIRPDDITLRVARRAASLRNWYPGDYLHARLHAKKQENTNSKILKPNNNAFIQQGLHRNGQDR